MLALQRPEIRVTHPCPQWFVFLERGPAHLMLGNHQQVRNVGTNHHVPGSLGGKAIQPHHCPNLGSSSPSLLHSIVPTSFQELPDPEKVSSEVQQMWVLTEVIRARQAAARIGRFDVSPTTLLTRTLALPHGSGALPEGLEHPSSAVQTVTVALFPRWMAATMSTCFPTPEPAGAGASWGEVPLPCSRGLSGLLHSRLGH